MKKSKSREEALLSLKKSLTPEQISDIKLVIETAEVQGDYVFDGEGSTYEDDVNQTLGFLSREFD